MNVVRKIVVIGGLMVSAAATADISYNAAVTSDYRFRGLSQSAQDPAVQGGVDYSHESGLYAGAWASTIDFDASSTGGTDPDANVELDLYGGYKWKMGDVDLDAGLIFYAYPGSESSADLDFVEVYFGGTYGPGFAKLFYTNDYTGTTDEDAFYVTAGANVDVGSGYTLGVSAGHSFGDGIDATFTDPYSDWKIGVSKEFFGFGFNLSYIDTDLDPEVTTDVGNSEATVVLTVTKTF